MISEIESFFRSLLYRRKFVRIGKNCKFSGKCQISGRGEISLGDNVTLIKATLSAGQGAKIVVGNNCYLSSCTLAAMSAIEVGDETLISGQANIIDTDWHGLQRSERGKVEPVVVGKHVWICAGATLLKGVSVGDNAIVGFGSVVTRDVAANTIVAGNPAKKIGDTDGYGLFAT